MPPGRRGGLFPSCSAGTFAVLSAKCQANIVLSGSASGCSAGMAARGSAGPAHAGRRKQSDVRLRFTAKSPNQAWARPWVPVALPRCPGAGKSALFCACTRRTSFVSPFAHRGPRSRRSVLPRAVSRVSRRFLPPLGLAVLRNRHRLAEASSRRTCSRARRMLLRVGVVQRMDMVTVTTS